MARKIEYGINLNPRHELGQPADANALKGLRWIRIVYGAASVHKSVDQVYAFYDELVDRYNAVGVRTLFVINQETFWGNAPWDSGDWARYANDFGAAVAQIAAHYKGKGVAYEIWNEGDIRGHSSIFVPPVHFAPLLARISENIKAQDPDAPVIFGGLAAAPDAAVQYVKDVRDHLNGDLPVDALGVHPYGKWPPNFSSPPTWGGWFAPLDPHLQLFLTEFPDMNLWLTEIGVSEPEPFPRSQWPMVMQHMRGVYDLVQSKYWHRIPVVLWFAWSDAMRNAGIVDAQGQPKGDIYTTFFELAKAEPPPPPLPEQEPLPDPATVDIPPKSFIEPTARLNMRAEPVAGTRIVELLDAGENLTVVEPWEEAFLKIGRRGHWINVLTDAQQTGWVAAWWVQVAAEDEGAPPADLYFTSTVTLNIRAGAGTTHAIVDTVTPGDRLLVLEPARAAGVKLGQTGEWVKIRTPDDKTGYGAAWFLKHLEGDLDPKPEVLLEPVAEPVAPEPEPEPIIEDAPPEETFAVSEAAEEAAEVEAPPAAAEPEPSPEPAQTGPLLATPTSGLNVRDAANGPTIVATITTGTKLIVLGDRATEQAKIGQAGEWLNVQLPDGKAGWVAAWFCAEASADDFKGIGRLRIADKAERLVLAPLQSLNVRGGPRVGFTIVDGVKETEMLEALEDPATVRAKLGKQGNWLRVRTSDNVQGWAAAWLVEAAPAGAQAPPEGRERPDWRTVRTTRITRSDEPVVSARDAQAGEARAKDFQHEPIFSRLPVVDVNAIVNFSGFGPNNFSYRIHDNRNFYSNLCQLHNGLDFGHPDGTLLCAMDWGVVVYAGPRAYGAGPFNVIVRHGAFVVLYGHMNANLLVQTGRIVKPGDPLGGSGTAFGYPHLHFEVRRINPEYIARLARQAEGSADPVQTMNDRFSIRGWTPVQDHYNNPALYFDPPLEYYWEQYGFRHADWLPQDADRNGFTDKVARAGESVPTAYDLYAISSVPPGKVFQFWAGSRKV